MDFEGFDYGHTPPPRKKKRGLSVPVPAVNVAKSIREVLKDRELFKALTELGGDYKDYEKMLDFLSGLSMVLLSYSLENIQRLQAFEPKTADMLIELQSLINTTMGQVGGLLRSLAGAHRHALYEALLIRDVMVFQLRNIQKAEDIPEETKRAIFEKLKSALEKYEPSKPDERKAELEALTVEVKRLLNGQG